MGRFSNQHVSVVVFQSILYPALVGEIKGEALVDSLYQHEALLRGLQEKRAFSDIERRLMIANRRATGIKAA
jgi:hypothetical protein